MTTWRKGPGASRRPLRYVALGDSYTIGTSVRAEERWPNQLVTALAGGPSPLALVANLGVNGFTSRDLIRVELPELERLRPEFASVLIGVNDVVQGVPSAVYRRNVETILGSLLGWLVPSRIVTVATPDYTVTPAGADYGDPRDRYDGIVAANAILAGCASDRGIAFVDTFDLSRRAGSDRTLVADDGLHPSGIQYALWVERIAPVVSALLGASAAAAPDEVSDQSV